MNVHTAALEDCGGPPEVGLADRPIAGAGLGGAVLEIAPGTRGWPYHWEAAQEEWLLVLSGTPTLRTPEGEQVLRPGDLTRFPCGPAGAHELRNDGAEPCRALLFCNRAEANAVVYPDSGKVLVRSPHNEAVYRDEVPYW